MSEYGTPINDQPEQVCFDCGRKHGHRIPAFGPVWRGDCGVCGNKRTVADPADFGYLKPTWQGEDVS